MYPTRRHVERVLADAGPASLHLDEIDVRDLSTDECRPTTDRSAP